MTRKPEKWNDGDRDDNERPLQELEIAHLHARRVLWAPIIPTAIGGQPYNAPSTSIVAGETAGHWQAKQGPGRPGSRWPPTGERRLGVKL